MVTFISRKKLIKKKEEKKKGNFCKGGFEVMSSVIYTRLTYFNSA